MKISILNLGCGKTKIPQSVGVDFGKLEGYVDVVYDLNNIPYPFDENQFDEIVMYHILEHLDNPIKIIEECHRLLKVNGRLHIRVPHFSSMSAFTDITHKRPFGYSSFDCFMKENDQHYYTKVSFKVLNKTLRYLCNYPRIGPYQSFLFKDHLNSRVKFLTIPVNYAMNIAPMFFERVWCYWIGGASEIYVCLEKTDLQ